MLYNQPFPNQVLHFLFSFSESVLRPYLWCFHELTSPYIPIDPELLYPTKLWLRRLISPLYILLLILLSIPALIAFVLRCTLHFYRKPYVLSVKNVRKIDNNEIKSSCNGDCPKWKNRTCDIIEALPSHFVVVSSNVCLLPECLSRCNNLGNTSKRSKLIGERIIIDQLHYQKMMRNRSQQEVNCKDMNFRLSDISKLESHQGSQELSSGIVSHFMKMDFLCLQECWDRDYCKILMAELHKEFPWILYDVGKTSLFSNYFVLNSGLMFASRYRILDAEFEVYKNSCKQCLFSSKGLLMVKVLLYQTITERYVGYIFNTHLQAFQGDNLILDKQLDDVLKWTDDFKKQTRDKHDVICFDILCGDFNLDNMSPGEKIFREHPVFSVYKDVCRQRPGMDKPWTVGTEMKQRYMWEKEVQTPDGLRDMLRDPYLRQRYIVDATVEKATLKGLLNVQPTLDEDGNYKYFPEGGRRRIDYVLYRDTCPVDVKSYHFVTRLATLTDHIAVCMSFTSQR